MTTRYVLSLMQQVRKARRGAGWGKFLCLAWRCLGDPFFFLVQAGAGAAKFLSVTLLQPAILNWAVIIAADGDGGLNFGEHIVENVLI
jgi:hypothetical protein